MTIDKALYVAHEWAELNNDGVIRLRADPLHKLPNATQYRRSEAEACWKRITAKILVVVGEETKFSAVLTPFIDSDIDQFASNNSKLISIPNAGHMLHFEAPDVLAEEIEKFLMM
jgi:pimeloyl-ACP methyl ester carboxylesterase